MIFDSHAHYDDDWFDEDREELLELLPQKGIDYVVNIGVDLQTSKNTIELTKKYPFIYGAIGFHPNEVGKMRDEHIDALRQLSQNEKVVAIGEIGMDYHYDEPEKDVQAKWFERQIELAKSVKLPMVIHSREAAYDTYEMMKACHAEEAGGVLHCFSYSKEMAKKFLDMGFYIGLGGVLTFKNGRRAKEVLAYTPMDRVLLETDCPYLTPVPFRGKRNCSLYLPYVLQTMSEIKGITVEEAARITKENAMKMYRIKEANEPCQK